MKKKVIVFGLIAGLLIASWCVGSVGLCYKINNFKGNMLLGYAAMLLALSLVFVGVKNYRDKDNGGIISFGKAFQLGLFITLIASTMYVIAWTIDYYVFIPDFMDKYSEQILREAHNSGTSKAEINSQIKQITAMKEMYKNPVMVVLLTYLEIFPVGLIVSVVTALILKRKVNNNGIAIA